MASKSTAKRSASKPKSRGKITTRSTKSNKVQKASTSRTISKRSPRRSPRNSPRRSPRRSGSKRRSTRAGPERFHNRIKKIKNHLSPKLRMQERTVDLINSVLNDILYNVTIRARDNTRQYRKKTITYTDVLVSAMNLFGESNKWIEKIMSDAEKKAEEFKN